MCKESKFPMLRRESYSKDAIYGSTMTRWDVFAIGNPLFDLQARVQDELVNKLGLAKGSVALIEEEGYDSLVPQIKDYLVNTTSGGSAANTSIGLAQLGGKVCFTGKAGNDDYGRQYVTDLEKQGVHSKVSLGDGKTGLSIILITPDAQRTMNTYLGMCRQLSPKDLNLEDLKASRYLYVTGYLWDTESQKETVLLALETARSYGVKTAMSLSDPFCVQRHREDFRRIVQAHVDLLFGNQEEMELFTYAKDPKEVLEVLSGYCETAVVTMSGEGSLIQHGEEIHEIPAYPVKAIDSTGAGDMYAAGLLYGLTHHIPLEKTGRMASYLASRVVAQLGPRLETVDMASVEQAI
jgi:sugar/nucleoside kinase (ribokinase family)